MTSRFITGFFFNYQYETSKKFRVLVKSDSIRIILLTEHFIYTVTQFFSSFSIIIFFVKPSELNTITTILMKKDIQYNIFHSLKMIVNFK